MMTKKSVVIVFDSGVPMGSNEDGKKTNSKRTAMANSFLDCADSVIEVWWGTEKGVTKIFRHDDSQPFPKTCDLMLVHISDDGRLDALRKLTEPTRPCNLIYYSGLGGSDSRIGRGTFNRIQRQISTREQALKKFEAEELLQFATNPKAPKPQLLMPASTKETIVAMAILCQGFLTVFAKDQNDIQGLEPDLQKALRLIGWRSNSDLSEVHEELSIVQRPDWWNDALNLTNAHHHHSHFASIDLKNALSMEWNTDSIPHDLSLLCETLKQATDDVDPGLVARCYLEIAEDLTV